MAAGEWIQARLARRRGSRWAYGAFMRRVLGVLCYMLLAWPLGTLGQSAAPSFGTGATVIGGGTCAVSTLPAGILATSMELSTASDWVVNTLSFNINQGLSKIRAGQLQETTAISKTLDGLAASFNQSLVQQTQTQLLLKGLQEKDPEFQPLNGCYASGLGDTGLQAVNASQQVKQTLAASQLQYRYMFGNPGQETAYLAERISSADTTAAALFPANGTIDAKNEVNARNYSLLLTNPTPVPSPPPTPANQKDPATQRSVADANVYNAQIALAQEAIDELTALHTASLPVSAWMQQDWAAMEQSGPVGGAVNGEISPDAALALEVRAHYANPNWYTRVMQEHETGLLREQVLMAGLELQMNYQRMQIEERLLALMAGQYSNQVNQQMRPALIRDYQAYRQSGVQ